MFEKLVVALLATVLGALLLYVFRLRQLYVVIPRLFSVSQLTSTGRMVELRVYNKSRGTEEDVAVSLEPSRIYEIVASTDATSSLKSAVIHIPRIPPGDDYSVLLLVENGDLTKDHVSTVSSKTTKGKVLPKIEDVPPNAGNVLLAILAVVLIAGGPIAAKEQYDQWRLAHTLAEMDYLKENGWSNYEGYADSDLVRSYGKGEFPIYQMDVRRVGDAIIVPFKVVNNTAGEMKVIATPDQPYRESDPEPWRSGMAFKDVEPMGNEVVEIRLHWPQKKAGTTAISFSISARDSYITVTKAVNIDK